MLDKKHTIRCTYDTAVMPNIILTKGYCCFSVKDRADHKSYRLDIDTEGTIQYYRQLRNDGDGERDIPTRKPVTSIKRVTVNHHQCEKFFEIIKLYRR